MKSTNTLLTTAILTLVYFVAIGQVTQPKNSHYYIDKFKQLKEELPGPNPYRTAAGAPGEAYYQQQADYQISVTLDDIERKIFGEETITYHNNSKDVLSYLWLQLDQNMRAQNSDAKKIEQANISKNKMSFQEMKRLQNDFDGGFKIEYVQKTNGTDLEYTINNTMMRVDLPVALKPGEKVSFKVKWWYNINNRMEIGGRSGYEHFSEDGNNLFTIAQFFPRMAVYNEVEGWQNKQFNGRSEFALPFGNYKVNIKVPADHIVGATGSLQNASSVLSAEQRKRFDQAKTSDTPVLIVTEEEARQAEQGASDNWKTWSFQATNVRDFAFASSRKFIWDAMGVKINGKTIMAMSYYPKEGNPLWEKYSTRVVAHTLKTYSQHTIDYAYPVAISVHTKWIGMEYPMICFNGGRPEPDGTYSESTKYGMISVIIHEVGHNFFPMIINSDERQWTWMDEGMNTFVQYLTEQAWDSNYPSRRGPPAKIVSYMSGNPAGMVPIMSGGDQLLQFGNNAYAKTATALNILRETVMGRELFDYAFKTYAERWAYKHPTPADFFRTMEDASAVDLDWFWRGWFYTTNYCDVALTDVKYFKVDTQDPGIEMAEKRQKQAEREKNITEIRNSESGEKTVLEEDPSMRDFYNEHDHYDYTHLDVAAYERYMSSLTEEEKALLDTSMNYYQLDFELVGGLVMPLIIKFEFEDGTLQVVRIPAEIWQKNNTKASKLYWFKNKVVNIVLDPFMETADTDRNNNYWPSHVEPTKFELYKKRKQYKYQSLGENPMQKWNKAKDTENGEESR